MKVQQTNNQLAFQALHVDQKAIKTLGNDAFRGVRMFLNNPKSEKELEAPIRYFCRNDVDAFVSANEAGITLSRNGYSDAFAVVHPVNNEKGEPLHACQIAERLNKTAEDMFGGADL